MNNAGVKTGFKEWIFLTQINVEFLVASLDQQIFIQLLISTFQITCRIRDADS